MAAQVWWTGTRAARVHAKPDCSTMKRIAYRRRSELTQYDVEDVPDPIPCLVCFPDSPRLRVVHTVCTTCKHRRPVPCEHNGAVLVWRVRHGQWTGKVGDSPYDPDSVTYSRKWVWPENAWRFALVEPVDAA